MPHIISDFIIWHSLRWTVQTHPDNIHQNFKTPSLWAFTKSFSLWAIKPRGKTRNRESNTSLKHVSLHAMGWKRSAVWFSTLSLWFVPNATKWHTVMTCQGQPFCSQTLTHSFSKTALYPQVNRPQWDNACCEITGWKLAVSMSRKHSEWIFANAYQQI